ncbi:MAG: zinc ABC transporter substrate-binding protein [Desulforhopalus sp.]
MKKINNIFFFSILSLILFASICVAGDKPTVFVSIIPQKYFVQQISKDLIDVEVMVQPGASPATYEPKPSQMANLSSCAAYFAIGVPFESAWLGKISAVNPSMNVVHTDKDIEKIAMARHHHEEEANGEHHEEGHHGGHHQNEPSMHDTNPDDHAIPDPHIWLSPTLVKKQAEIMLETLTAILPDHVNFFDANYREFMKEIDTLHGFLKATFQGTEGRRFMVFHPSWGYFAKEYGLEQIPIEIEGKTPKPAQLAEIIQHARKNDIQVIFVQPQFSKKSAEVVAREIRGEVFFADPLAEDWLNNLKEVGEKFKSAVR